jgi:acetyl-CoA carboxylase biotin carboxyl carrier protein
LAQEKQVAELEVQRGEDRVRIRLAVAIPEYHVPVPAPGAPAVAHAPAAAAAPPSAAAEPEATIVTSPIVGTFYEAPSPGAPVFAKVGDTVSKGQVLCIIESMKLMNEIESDYSGTIIKRMVENGQPVEYGQALFAIRAN